MYAVNTFIVSALMATVAISLSGSAGAVDCPADPRGMGVMIPLYVDPEDLALIDRVAAYGSSCTVSALVSGEGTGPPQDHVIHMAAFKRLADAGVKLYGYVHTLIAAPDTAVRRVADVTADIRTWFDHYGTVLTGIFVDEVEEEPSNANALSYYGALADVIHARGGRVVFNPGTQIGCRLAGLADVYVRFESSAADWRSEVRDGARCDCASSAACALLVYRQDDGSAGALQGLVAQAEDRGFSFVYLTDDRLPNPWDALPSYWPAFMRAVTGSSGPTPTPSPSPSPSPRPQPQPRPRPRPRRSKPSPRASPQPSPKPSPKPSPSPSPKPSPSPSPKPSPSPSPKPSPSPSPKPSPSPSPSPAPTPAGIWRPSGPHRWQWQLTGSNFRPMLMTKPDVIDVDVDAVEDMLAQAKQLSIARTSYKLICYFSSGTFEEFRTDADAERGVDWAAVYRTLGGMGGTAAGKAVPGPLFLQYMDYPWVDEIWFAIDSTAARDVLVQQVMIPRMQSAVRAGCDAIEMDNVDTYQNVPQTSKKRGVTLAQNLAYNQALLDAAHGLGLSVGLKNAVGMLTERFADGRRVADAYDWFLSEECYTYDECDSYQKSIKRPASVFAVEYCDAIKAFGDPEMVNLKPPCVCGIATSPAWNDPSGVVMNLLIKHVNLETQGADCRDYCARPGVTCAAPAGSDPAACAVSKSADICPSYSIV
ncbi:hypothetical protein HYH03_010888 [Edaphochlamys debaryana]|uniref:Glycoside-hydrolase family GH114 TIM-barrel domain-containing protein n=1 Tax=Edaphochlamys debaryana TaxID=47281 RepID=A0A835XXC9_9CHLO|nr:hypothetical protein HYH03_010888 [Edaphochlamys debaryana]|eukprot:KAG2490733.1 hypothetical protein HYH03_010888 [Edaphochlamys debaryana]